MVAIGELTQVRYEQAAPGIARIVLARPEKRNAQGTRMTYEIDAAMRAACEDDGIVVIILAADGDDFSAGHDLSLSESPAGAAGERVSLWGGDGGPGWEPMYRREREVYLEMCERWRNAPKPVIAAVQGNVISGGLTLMWVADLVVATADARFRDNTASDLGVPGVEFFAHPLELGVRRAKQFLFTGGWLSAQDALAAGMVNAVVPRAELAAHALALAQEVARTDPFTLKLVKASINAAQDAMGRREAMQAAFANHQVGHLQNMLVHGFPIDVSRLPENVRRRLEHARRAADA
ncbi:MAG: enoyl-CoA hydratase [Sphingomonadales bacterium]|nr:enoyl-CoA hydratase [Sphingomonadales bacterium]